MGKKFNSFIMFLSGFRKWTIMASLMLIGITFRIFDLLSGAEMVDLLKGTAIAFFTANVGEHIVSVIKEKFLRGKK